MNKLLIAAFLFGGAALVPAATFAQTVTVSLDPTTLGSTSVSPGTSVPFTAVRLTVSESQASISSIQVVSDSAIASQALTNFRVYDSGTPVTATYAVNLTFDGQQYQYWLNFSSPLVIPAGSSRMLTLYADVKPLSPGGTVRLGAGGLTFTTTGFAGWFPVYGNNITISSFTPNIVARSPNGGETWTVGGTGVISWSIGIGAVPSAWDMSVGGYPDVAIDLYRFRDNQYQFVQSLSGRHSAGAPAALPVPNVPAGSDYRIRVSAVGGSEIGATIFDFSDASFAITGSAPTSVSVSVSPTTPPADTIAAGLTNWTFAEIKFSGGSTTETVQSFYVGTDSVSANAASNLSNIRLYDGFYYGGAPLLGSISQLTRGGEYVGGWIVLPTPISIPAAGSRTFSLVADVAPQAIGSMRLGITGLFNFTGSSITGLPVFGNNMTIVAGSAAIITAVAPAQGAQGQTLDLVLSGSRFTGANSFSAAGVSPVSDRGWQIISANQVSDTQVNLRVAIAATATLGPRSITITTPTNGASNAVTFTVTAASASPTIALLSPNRGEYVNRGGPYTVRWSTSGTLPSDASAFLYLVRNNVALGRISASAVSASLNSYVWDTSAYFLEISGAARATEAGSDYKIKAVLQSGGGTIATALSEQFSLSDQIIRSVSVGVPNGGEQWQKGSVQTIQWGSSNVYEVVVYLLRTSGIVRTIADIATNPSQHRWTIPGDIPDGSDYRVRVVDPSTGIADDSDQSFTIVARQPGGAPLISDGSLIRARGYAEVWIVKGGYRRHIISPRIFTFYKHLGFAQVIDVEVGTVNQYAESRLIRAVGDGRVYELKPNGQKRWLNMYANQFLEIGHSSAEIYDINATERNFYATGPDLTPADFGIGR